MTIKYCDITIIKKYDSWTDNLLANLQYWTGYEPEFSENSDIIILFDDDTIYDLKSNLKDNSLKFFTSHFHFIPPYFEKNKNIYFSKKPIKKDNISSLNFNEIYKFSETYKINKSVSSLYNCIYYCHKNGEKPEIFSILRIYSNEEKPRFILAYDSDEFNKDEIFYLIYCFFYNKFNTKLV